MCELQFQSWRSRYPDMFLLSTKLSKWPRASSCCRTRATSSFRTNAFGNMELDWAKPDSFRRSYDLSRCYFEDYRLKTESFKIKPHVFSKSHTITTILISRHLKLHQRMLFKVFREWKLKLSCGRVRIILEFHVHQIFSCAQIHFANNTAVLSTVRVYLSEFITRI